MARLTRRWWWVVVLLSIAVLPHLRRPAAALLCLSLAVAAIGLVLLVRAVIRAAEARAFAELS